MDLKIKHKTVFISASGQGIGAETAKLFLEEGCYVLINDTNINRLHKFCSVLKKKYRDNIDYFVGDMTDEQKISELKKYLINKRKGIDMLVTNLGSGKALSKDKMETSEWTRFMEINLLSGIKLIKAFLPIMKKKKSGSIVMLSSIVGFQRSSAPLGYAAAKSAVLSVVKNLSYDLAPFGIRINAVAPGNIYFKGGRWEEIIKTDTNIVNGYIARDVPLKRFGKPEEIASAVVFLASPRSSFTTGTCLVVDGGEIKGY